jgi:trigger factor
VPKALIEQDQQRLVEMARQDLAQRGMPNAKDAPIPAEMFAEQAERRVKLGLVLAELVKANGLEAKPEQIRAEVGVREELRRPEGSHALVLFRPAAPGRDGSVRR